MTRWFGIVQYDPLLNMEQPKEATLVGFTNDIVAVISVKGEEILMNTANRVLLKVANWMEQIGLNLASEKPDAVLQITRRKILPVSFSLLYLNVSQNLVLSTRRKILFPPPFYALSLFDYLQLGD